MTDRELETLKALAVPAPREEARARALNAALTAFDETAEKSAPPAQGSSRAARPIPVPHPGDRRKPMSAPKFNYAMAASLVTLAVAVPALLLALRDSPSVPLGPVVSQAGSEVKPDSLAKAEADAQAAYRGRQGLDPQVIKEAEGLRVARVAPGQQDLDKRADTAAADLKAPTAPAAAKPQAAPAEPNAYVSDTGATLNSNFKFTGPAQVAPGAPVTHGAAPYVGGEYLSGRAPQPEAGVRGRIANAIPHRPDPYPVQVEQNRDQHAGFDDNAIKQVAVEPVSTFSLDVDTASYAFGRRVLNAGRLPQPNAVRVEEMINYFSYAYPAPESADVPFAPAVSIFPAPWNTANKLVHIGIKGYTLQSAERPRANLVFLIDVSGSMAPEDRLPLVKNAFRLLLDQLKPDDTVGIVTYASGSGVALSPTRAANRSDILAAIDRLGAGGSTAGAQGITDAYALAEANFDKNGVNRIILATDGDFNVGITNRDELKSFVERKRQKGIFLSILGVGIGNHNDAMMQALAQNGNGVAAYVDTLSEARKVLVEEASASLFTIAKDVKIQVEFNPAAVAQYRLIGYETRALKREDFNNDKVDAGDVGSGHTVTAIYEITPVGASEAVDPLRYGPQTAQPRVRPEPASEFGFLKMRYKLPKEDASKLLTIPLTTALEKRSIADASTEARFSVAVAGFGQLLRSSPHVKDFNFDDVITLAGSARGEDPFGYRAEFLNLARLAKSARP
jgi:Ca-activated chloride channel homolog